MVPPSTTPKPAGTPSLAEWASTFQCAVQRTCQMPFRSGLRSGVRGPLYADVVWAAEARDGAAPRCACATPAAVAMVNKARPVAPPIIAISFIILTRESLPQPVVKVRRRTEGGEAPLSTPRRTVRAVGGPGGAARRPHSGVPNVRVLHGGVQYREYLREEQRSQPGAPAARFPARWGGAGMHRRPNAAGVSPRAAGPAGETLRHADRFDCRPQG